LCHGDRKNFCYRVPGITPLDRTPKEGLGTTIGKSYKEYREGETLSTTKRSAKNSSGKKGVVVERKVLKGASEPLASRSGRSSCTQKKGGPGQSRKGLRRTRALRGREKGLTQYRRGGLVLEQEGGGPLRRWEVSTWKKGSV